jgi:arylsulfatase A-like enzyme/tetratricopeptide (TPR) repeat protein
MHPYPHPPISMPSARCFAADHTTFPGLLVRALSLLFTLACGTTTQSVTGTDPAKPNIIVFTLDTLRADALGVYGQKLNSSPNIDALANAGYRFARAYTVTPLTIPAHSSLWTSMWPPRHGVQDNGDFFLDEGATTLAERLQDAGYQTMASVGAEVTSHHWGFAQGFDAYFDDLGTSRGEEKNRWRVERPATEVVADAMGWFQQDRTKDKPFFAWLHLFDIHHPYRPPEPFKSQFEGRPYLGEIAWTDSQVQTFLNQIDALGELENTWIFILADHGEGRGSHGEMLHGSLLYNSTTRIPFIVIPPKRDGGGKKISFPVSIVDVYPTALKLAGMDVPEDLDGLDLTPWLQPNSVEELKGREVYVESLYAYRHYGWAPQKAYVTDGFKLIDSTTPELYTAWDLPEKTNLASKQTDTLGELTANLRTMTTSMVNDDNAATRVELSPERLEQLAALGYITTTVDTDTPTQGLPDPVSRMPMLKEVEKARQLLQSGEVDAAAEQINSILKEEPTFVDMRTLQTQLLLRMGKIDEAYAAAIAIEADHPSTNNKAIIANILLRKGDMVSASLMFESIIDIDPYMEDIWRGWLTTLFLGGRIPELDNAVQHAKLKLPDANVTHTFEGLVLFMRNDLAGAEALLVRVLENNPRQPFVNHTMGLIRRGQGLPNEAEQFLREEVRLHPPAVPARRTLVELLAEQNRYGQQLRQLRVIERAEPPNPLTAHSTAQALYNLDRIDEAAKVLTTCFEIDSQYPGCAMLWANVLKKQGKNDEAKVAYEKAIELQKSARKGRGRSR